MRIDETLGLEELRMKMDQEFGSYMEFLEARALKRGREEGRQEGRQEGQWEATQRERRNMVKLLLKHTGQSISPGGAERLEKADADQLQVWIDALDEGRMPPELGFRQLFAFPEMVLELLRTAVSDDWTRSVRCRDLEHVNASYAGADGQQRHGDNVWCVHRDRSPNVYMFIEFQSSTDKWMALRMRSYTSLMCEDLLKQRGATRGRLPILLPIVFYSGSAPWNAAQSLATMSPDAPPGTESLQPKQNYLLVDRSSKPGVIRYVLELDKRVRDDSEPREMIAIISAWLGKQHNSALASAVREWIVPRVAKQFPNMRIDETLGLEELRMKMEQEFGTYMEFLEARTLKRGREEGRQEGWQEGQWEATQRERRNTVKLLLKHTGQSISPGGAAQLEKADADQLQVWIDALDERRMPPELSA